VTLSATTYFMDKLKNVAADAGSTVLSCANNLYGTGDAFCYVNRFIYADVNVSWKVDNRFTVYGNIGNITDAKAPLRNSGYISTWHLAGVIGRTFRAGVRFSF
jgi:iron complex outermembrane receptor protein